MEELTIEQKAQAYDEAINKVMDYYDGKTKLHNDIDQVLNYLFPNIKEEKEKYDDKQMIELIYCFLSITNNYSKLNDLCKIYNKCPEDVLNWIQKKYNNEGNNKLYEITDSLNKIIKNSADEEIVNAIKNVSILDMWELNFYVGDWISNGFNTYYVAGINIDKGYIIEDKNGIIGWLPFNSQKQYHLWTINDVKNGDILQLGEVTAIFKEFIGESHCKCYCSVCDGKFEIPNQIGDDNNYGCYNAIPANKEHRNYLFQKMKDAGYEGYEFDESTEVFTLIKKENP